MSKWIPYGDSFSSFKHKGLSRPGTLVDVDGSIHLIGSINDEGGTCDCCSPVQREIVKRYRVIVNTEGSCE